MTASLEETMDFNDTPEEAAFRKEVRAWLDANATRKSDDKASFRARNDDPELLKKAKAWQDKKAKAGYARITWPKEYGGRAVPLSQQVIFYQEYARAGGPGRVGHIGEGLVAPTILAFGSEEQKQRFLPGIKNGTELWCQGYS
jgi:acyl-CoA dehydrogenase